MLSGTIHLDRCNDSLAFFGYSTNRSSMHFLTGSEAIVETGWFWIRSSAVTGVNLTGSVMISIGSRGIGIIFKLELLIQTRNLLFSGLIQCGMWSAASINRNWPSLSSTLSKKIILDNLISSGVCLSGSDLTYLTIIFGNLAESWNNKNTMNHSSSIFSPNRVVPNKWL